MNHPDKKIIARFGRYFNRKYITAADLRKENGIAGIASTARKGFAHPAGLRPVLHCRHPQRPTGASPRKEWEFAWARGSWFRWAWTSGLSFQWGFRSQK